MGALIKSHESSMAQLLRPFVGSMYLKWHSFIGRDCKVLLNFIASYDRRMLSVPCPLYHNMTWWMSVHHGASSGKRSAKTRSAKSALQAPGNRLSIWEHFPTVTSAQCRQIGHVASDPLPSLEPPSWPNGQYIQSCFWACHQSWEQVSQVCKQPNAGLSRILVPSPKEEWSAPEWHCDRFRRPALSFSLAASQQGIQWQPASPVIEARCCQLRCCLQNRKCWASSHTKRRVSPCDGREECDLWREYS